ncbi:MAG: M48 family metallopeptidase [Candidatus Diapherotrites archaeon]|nr:M48 family metallopeptidase [Candidatus Diapherotrites archaeon]
MALSFNHDVFCLNLGEEKVECTIRRSARARNIALHVTQDASLEVRIPLRWKVPMEKIMGFIKEKEKWILRNVKKMKMVHKEVKAREGHILFLGREVPVEIVESSRKRAVAKPKAGKLSVEVNKENKEGIQEAVIKFYKKHARAIIEKISRKKATEMGVSFKKISVRSQKSRWGSCSSKKTISFNFCLIAAPQEVLEYVVVHELAHLVHRNHSKAFWALVEKHCPNYRQHKKWLNRNGLLLKRRVMRFEC